MNCLSEGGVAVMLACGNGRDSCAGAVGCSCRVRRAAQVAALLGGRSSFATCGWVVAVLAMSGCGTVGVTVGVFAGGALWGDAACPSGNPEAFARAATSVLKSWASFKRCPSGTRGLGVVDCGGGRRIWRTNSARGLLATGIVSTDCGSASPRSSA